MSHRVLCAAVLLAWMGRVSSQYNRPQQFAPPLSSSSPDHQERLVWLENVLRELERDGQLRYLIWQEGRDGDLSIPGSLPARIAEGGKGESYGLMEPFSSHFAEGYTRKHHRNEEGYDDSSDDDSSDDDSSDDDSSDDDSRDDDSSDEDSSDDKRHVKKHHKKHRHHKCKCKKHKKKKDEDTESNVFSKIRGVIIGSTFANIQITGANATAGEETPVNLSGLWPGGLNGLNRIGLGGLAAPKETPTPPTEPPAATSLAPTSDVVPQVTPMITPQETPAPSPQVTPTPTPQETPARSPLSETPARTSTSELNGTPAASSNRPSRLRS